MTVDVTPADEHRDLKALESVEKLAEYVDRLAQVCDQGLCAEAPERVRAMPDPDVADPFRTENASRH